jgi:hypothetical protein
MIKRLLCRLGLHYWGVWHDGTKFVSQCHWCPVYEKGYEP